MKPGKENTNCLLPHPPTCRRWNESEWKSALPKADFLGNLRNSSKKSSFSELN
jgi:hypothetical protein